MFKYMSALTMLACALSGCSNGQHFVRPEDKNRPIGELVRIQAEATANPRARAPFRTPQPVPYFVDGIEVPYEWTGSGRHEIIFSPGAHNIEGLVMGFGAYLPSPADPFKARVFVYESPYRPESQAPKMPAAVLIGGETVCIRYSEEACSSMVKVPLMNGYVGVEFREIFTPDFSRLIRVKGTFSAQPGLYTWSQIVSGLANACFTAVEDTGTKSATCGMSLRTWLQQANDLTLVNPATPTSKDAAATQLVP